MISENEKLLSDLLELAAALTGEIYTTLIGFQPLNTVIPINNFNVRLSRKEGRVFEVTAGEGKITITRDKGTLSIYVYYYAPLEIRYQEKRVFVYGNDVSGAAFEEILSWVIPVLEEVENVLA